MYRKHIHTTRLEIAYLEDGPEDGAPVLLLHGFPDDATGWRDVMAGLAAQGYRALAPYIRGCGLTRFLRTDTPRAGDFAALGQDAVDFVDALALNNLIVVGQDWGSPTAEVVAMQRPDRVRRLVKLNWYGVYSMAEMARAREFSYPQLRALWYVWMFNTPLGEMTLRNDRAGLARALWTEWSPTWDAAAREAALGAVAGSFDGEDWVRVALSAYRVGITDAEMDRADDALRERLKEPPPCACEAVILNGADDGVERTPLEETALARYFPAGARVETLDGVGHFPQRELPVAVIRFILGQ
ncbi:alpha/beta hydrolase [Chroococcidiopsis sp. CCMEE 29]|uniref:alpha/beta fold hydrolase n=1 Tax=Chroococcidiopsis sp. CCMEE 29 TaxID=155894 RepID=UPI0020222F46|nr:alpha/beta hydrolase [Chroococcidiopsis sp. CCMEE 29]